ncbi:MAG TPA: hypothetical protein VLH35_03965 [Candidatus Acidoferrales bacterium]|nr:hypothetical protein [Candidatus Acidoferrales bacterium]
MQRQINYIGLVAGILTLVLIAISAFIPWWQFTVGDPAIAQMGLSPVTYNMAIFGQILTMPLVYALTLGSMLTLIAGGVIMLIYSVFPTKKYSKQLLGFGYKKPLYAIILFSIALLGVYFSAKYLGGMDVPISGTGTMGLPEAIGDVGVGVSIKVTSSLNWPFYLAIVVAALCIAARVYHRKIKMPVPATVAPAAPIAAQTPPPPPPVSMN